MNKEKNNSNSLSSSKALSSSLILQGGPSRNISSKKPSRKKSPYVIAMIGTALEYYDASLYGFMAPLLAPLFWPNQEPVLAILYSYALYPLSLFSAPLGAWIFGKIGDEIGRKKALTFSISGMASVTLFMAVMPTYASVGILAPILLAIAKMLQSFFAAGEYNGGAIYALEFRQNKNPGYISGLYCSFTVSGILAASLAAAFVAKTSVNYWRWPYVLSLVTAIVGFFLRRYAAETPEFINRKKLQTEEETIYTSSFKKSLKHYWPKMLMSMGVAFSFSVLYCLSALFMTAFVPLITNISTEKTFLLNSGSLVVYMLFLTIGGILGDRIGIIRSMTLASIAILLCAWFLFKGLKNATLWDIIWIKVVFSILGGWFVGPIHAWLQTLFPVTCRYRLVSLSYTLGSKLGGASPSVAIWLWHITQFPEAPAAVLFLSALVGLFSLRKSIRLNPN